VLLLQPHKGLVLGLAFSPDGRFLASVGADGRVNVWKAGEVHRAKPLWGAEADESSAAHVEFDPRGHRLYTCGDEGVVRAWDAATGRLVKELIAPDETGPIEPGVLAVSRDGRHVAWAGGFMWQRSRIAVARTSDWSIRLLPGHPSAIGIMAAGPGVLLSGSADRQINFWDWESGRRYYTLRMRGFVRTLAVDPAGTRLAATCGKVVQLWELASRPGGRPRPDQMRARTGHTRHVRCVAFSPDGAALVSTAEDGTLRVWDVATGTERRAFSPGLGPLHWVAFAPDGLTVAFTTDAGHVGVLDVDD
jgi:WD40 repeat protein